MLNRPDNAAASRGVRSAADQLLKACAGTSGIRIDSGPVDALAAGVAAIGRIYDRAAAPVRRRSTRRSK